MGQREVHLGDDRAAGVPGINTLYGGFLNIRDNYYPLATGANAARHIEGLGADHLQRRS